MTGGAADVDTAGVSSTDLARVLDALAGVPATACNTAAETVIRIAAHEGGTVTLGRQTAPGETVGGGPPPAR
jgi:hypothetical protein